MPSIPLFAGYASTRRSGGAHGLPQVEIGTGPVHAVRDEEDTALCGAEVLWPLPHGRQLWESCVAPRCPQCAALVDASP